MSILGPRSLVDRRMLGGAFGVREAGRRMSNFRWLEMDILEMLGGWSEAMLYPAIRVGFGLQMYTQAVHCRDLGWALSNLKRAKQQLQAPSDEFVRLCERVWLAESPLLRLVGLYRVLKPHLLQAELYHADLTDPVGDSFSIHVLQQCAANHERDITWGNAQIERLAANRSRRSEALDWQADLEADLAASGGVTAEGAPAWWLPYADEHADRDTESIAARRELPGHGELRSQGYRYTKIPPESLLPNGVQPFPEPLRYAAEVPGEPRHPDSDVPTTTPNGLRYAVHQLWLGESRTVDRCGRFICDFPDLPFGLKFDMAQQAWEEARHMEIDAQIVQILGGTLGMYPFAKLMPWRDTVGEPNPFVRLLRGHVVFEGVAAATTNRWLAESEGWASAPVRQGLEHLSADERVHIAFGNDWTLRLIGDRPDQLEIAVEETIRQIESLGFHDWSDRLRQRYIKRGEKSGPSNEQEDRI
jgi:hypothetical protein